MTRNIDQRLNAYRAGADIFTRGTRAPIYDTPLRQQLRYRERIVSWRRTRAETT